MGKASVDYTVSIQYLRPACGLEEAKKVHVCKPHYVSTRREHGENGQKDIKLKDASLLQPSCYRQLGGLVTDLVG